jgi:hypothetical protein
LDLYKKSNGVFIQQDKIGFGGGDTNLYRYVGNSPTNYTDPTGELKINLLDVLEAAGIDTPLSDIPGIEKYVEIEFNAGEEYAEKAVEYYAQIIADPDSPWYKKALAYVGGTFASLWTCENSSTTVTTLLSAWNVRKLASNIKIQDVKDGFEYTKEQANDFLRGRNRNQTPSSMMNCSSSFLAGTEVLTPDGLKKIEDIEVGDWVISDDPETEGGVIAKQVTRTFERTDNNGIVDIEIGDEVISTTGNHEFWLDEKGWVEAKDIEEGDLLWTDDGDFVAVDGISTREGTFEVFNFEVDDFHTYFVSDDGVLVHNIECNIAYNPKWNDADKEIVNNKVDAINQYLEEKGGVSIEFDPVRGKKILGKPIGDPDVKEAFKEEYIAKYGSWPVDQKGKVYNVDHTVDLQFSGTSGDVVSNMQPLPDSVNKSLGVKIHNAMLRQSKATGNNPILITKINVE